MQVAVGTIAEALPKPYQPETPAIAAELVRFIGVANAAEAQAELAVIDSEESFGDGGEVVRSITRSMNAIEEARKARQRPYNDAKALLATLFGRPHEKLAAAKQKLLTKMSQWQRAETRRREEAAAAEAKRIADEAAKQAAAAKAMGDDEGAEQIIAEAEGFDTAPVKVTGTGTYGAKVGTTNRAVGEVTNISEFLVWIGQNDRDPRVVGLLAAIHIGQQELNRLAKYVLEAPPTEPVNIPGFSAKYDESLNIR